MTREEEIHNAYKKHLLTEGNPSNGFEYGARWADAHPINPWHKVSEELPKEKGMYLIWITEYNHPVTMLWGDYGWDNPLQDAVEYWMEIPEIKED